MQNLLEIHLHEGVETVDSRLIASELGLENRSLVKLADKHKDAIEKDFGLLVFEMLKVGIGRPTKVYYFTEDQALFIRTARQKTPIVFSVGDECVG